MSKATIITGEASETDSDDELAPKLQTMNVATFVQGAVVTGEDSESENENETSVCSAVSALDDTNCSTNHDSLLHQKLRECNGKLRKDVEGFCQNIIDTANKNLASTDQQLIKSQLNIQNAVTSLKTIGINATAIKNKLELLLSAEFIPKIAQKID